MLTLGFTLIDGQSVKVGMKWNFSKSHTFDPTKKITRVETMIDMHEDVILRINFYHHGERLVAVGLRKDADVEVRGGRVEVFDIADDEQLIGCKFDQYILGY